MTLDPDSDHRSSIPSDPLRDGGERIDAPRERLIIAAAYDLLEEAGLEGLTIRAVLHRTGLSRRAFYERFAGKDDLVLAVFAHTIRSAAAHYAELLAPVADPMERLRLVVRSIVLARSTLDGAEEESDTRRRGAAMSREHLRLAESRPADLQAALSPLIDLLAQLLADGMDAGQVRRAQPERLATLVYNLVATTVHAEMLAEETEGPNQQRRAELAADIWEFCRRAILA
ncbi:MAG: helix-turn-helix domain-containing protein [Sphingobium sp.]